MNRSNNMVKDAVETDYSQVPILIFGSVFLLFVDELVKQLQ